MNHPHPNKYKPFPRVRLKDRKWPDATITRAPIWCSVDLRDGNQALAVPMSVSEKLEMFALLVQVGFKEIEVGFPSASQTEFDFIRLLIEGGHIPEDVTIQVLTQAREHLIRRTFEALKGAKKVIVHLYNSTSPLQRKITFRMSPEEIKQIAVDGTKLVKSLVPSLPGTQVRFEYSPESFSDTEPEFALEVCEAVMQAWGPTQQDRIILNLPHTVEWDLPNVHADQIEWFCGHLKARDKAIISVHTHNDRGTGVAAAELCLLAGADRAEGTLFGNGERTGNLDLVTMALNLYMHGISPDLDFSHLPEIREVYERCTRMQVPPRHPYAGDLVFTAFSGSHQDAIKKGMDLRGEDVGALWQVPYLTIDPRDVGRDYEAIIRINSQSGKGGIAYILSRDFGLDLPKSMHPEIGNAATAVADKEGRELSPEEIFNVFKAEYLQTKEPLSLGRYRVQPEADGGYTIEAGVHINGREKTVTGRGNGPINAFVHALEQNGWKHFRILDYRSHAVTIGSASDSIAYVQVVRERDKATFWGAGINSNIESAGLFALVSAINRAFKGETL